MSPVEKHRKKRSDAALERRMSPDWNEWSLYSFAVRSLTLKNYRKHKSTIDPNNLRSHHYHLDHIVSIDYCFKANIPAELCASVQNLTITEAKRNLRKSSKLTKAALDILESWNITHINDF